MLSLGFLEDVEWILKQAPAGRQTLLFSATMPPPIRRLAERFLHSPELREGRVGDAHRRPHPPDRDHGRAAREARRADRADPAPRSRRPRSSSASARSASTSSPTPLRAPRRRRLVAARRHDPGPARLRDAALPLGPRTPARRHQRGGARTRHLARLARDQLRPPGRPRGVHAPHRPHRPRRPHRHRDHVREPQGRRARRRDRAGHRRRDRAARPRRHRAQARPTDVPAQGRRPSSSSASPQRSGRARTRARSRPRRRTATDTAAHHRSRRGCSSAPAAATARAATTSPASSTATGVEPLRIKVHHAFSFVDVPTEASERVIAALAEAELAGRKRQRRAGRAPARAGAGWRL